MSVPSRSALRYHGGKWRAAPWIIGHFPPHRIYTEAYGGAGSVLLRKPRASSEIYNDLDGELVNVFRVLRDDGLSRELARLLELTPYARSEWRAAFLPSDDPVERARRTIVRSFMGFGSDGMRITSRTGFRSMANSRDETSASDWSRYPGVVGAFCARLAGVLIDDRPAVEVILEHDSPATLHYLDPPYPHSTRTGSRGYSIEMTDDDHRGLAAVARGLAGHVVVSGYPCDLYDRELYPDWKRVERRTLIFRQAHRTECLWLSPSVAARPFQPNLSFGGD